MNSQLSLKRISIISFIEVLFLSYSSYEKYFKNLWDIDISCIVVSEIPAGVYDFIIYLIIFKISNIGVMKNEQY